MQRTIIFWKTILWCGILLVLGAAGASDLGQASLAQTCIYLLSGIALSLLGGYRLSRAARRKQRNAARREPVLRGISRCPFEHYGGEAA